MKLYFTPGACSMVVHAALLETGLPFSIERVDLATRRTAGGADFCSINPKGYVPALALDDGAILTELPAIVQYLDDLAPQAGLLPPSGALARYRALEWLGFISSELHKNFSPLFNPVAGDEMRAVARAALAARLGYVAGQLEKREFLGAEGFSIADVYLFTVLGWADYLQFSLADWPVFQAYRARVATRPSLQQAMRAEGLIK